MYQKITIAGYLGRDPEMRYAPDGTPVTNFSVATTDRWTGNDGERHERTTWWRVSVWGRMAEVCNEYLSKGRPVLIEGRMNPDPETGGPRVYARRDGTYGASYELTAQRVVFLGRGSGSSEGPKDDSEDEDEIPF